MNVGFFDIESEVDLSLNQGYPTPENPYGQINSISLYDRSTNLYHMIILPPDGTKQYFVLKDDECKVIVHSCVNEKQLLDTFSRLIADIDVLSGWNIDRYDIPYLMERAKKVYGARKGQQFLSRDSYLTRSRKATDDFGNEFTKYTLVGRVTLDYLELYKKFTLAVSGEMSSYSLDSVCQKELRISKLPYKGDLGTLYKEDPKTFFEYSLHDSRLLKKLDDKVKFIDLAKMIVRRATVKYSDVFGSIRYLEHTILNYCHFDRDEKVILPDRGKHEKEAFPGAFVMDTKPGVYGWVCSIDIASLYPSVIRALNISPETHLMQLKRGYDDFVKVTAKEKISISVKIIDSGEELDILATDIYDIIRENGYTITANGSILDSKQGLIPEVLELWVAERKETKKKMQDAQKRKDENLAEYYNLRQLQAKLMGNSQYGAISNPYCRFYSLDLAASVTLTGQMIERFQCWKADRLVEEMK